MTPLDPDEVYHFVFGSPDDTPTAWGMSYEALEDAIRRVDPRSFISRSPLAMKDGELFCYALTFPFGEAEGNAGIEDFHWISIEGATIDKAAHLAAWLRQEIVPPDTAIAFNIFEGIENAHPPATLPNTDNLNLLRAALEQLVQNVLAP